MTRPRVLGSREAGPANHWKNGEAIAQEQVPTFDPIPKLKFPKHFRTILSLR